MSRPRSSKLALLCAATALVCLVPAILMGSDTYYFIRENPDWSDTLTGDTAVWRAEIIETESDSTLVTPDGWEATDTAEIHSMGLLTPTEAYEAATTKWEDKHESPGRMWISWLIPGCAWYQNKQWRTMYNASGTYRTGFWPGLVAVRGRCFINSVLKWDSEWRWSIFSKSIVVGKSWMYPLTSSWVWDEYGYHDWGTPPTATSHIQGVW